MLDASMLALTGCRNYFRRKDKEYNDIDFNIASGKFGSDVAHSGHLRGHRGRIRSAQGAARSLRSSRRRGNGAAAG